MMALYFGLFFLYTLFLGYASFRVSAEQILVNMYFDLLFLFLEYYFQPQNE